MEMIAVTNESAKSVVKRSELLTFPRPPNIFRSSNLGKLGNLGRLLPLLCAWEGMLGYVSSALVWVLSQPVQYSTVHVYVCATKVVLIGFLL